MSTEFKHVMDTIERVASGQWIDSIVSSDKIKSKAHHLMKYGLSDSTL